ncbi:RNA ligase-domain-containing protein [Gautieria morchelliformis]|nr:RNA ligase-domain-containing protein [Gautieria morchelliformis]
MNEFKYYEVPSPFPTLARGLFTSYDGSDVDAKGEGPSNGKYSIVARGYDKFFNIGEVPWTNWKALETHTTAPYVLTLKSNGCIIFIAPLTKSKLLITSKHSIGPIKGQDQSHAEVGERWLRKHLASVGRTEEEFAKTLWENNWTAVAELCDDSFEEHVLPYSEELTGLHLHGINTSTGAFQTRKPEEVEAFAREWGFIPTAYTTFSTVAEVREFTQEISKTGKWNGQSIEGFVVRTHIADSPSPPAGDSDVPTDGSGRRARDQDAPPYPPGSSFFFKIKFDEPYMMYRDWREITKSLLTAKAGKEPRISKAKLNRPETRLYKTWVEGEIKRDRKAFDGYTHNQGIVATRERFLKWCEGEGKGKLAQEAGTKAGTVVTDGKKDGKKVEFRKTVVIPVAVPGCGKTSIAVALKHLFGFGHTQNDDVKAKKTAPIFLQNVKNLLTQHDVVIADKNNHLAQHRQGLRDALASFRPPVRLVALNWSLDQPPAMIHRICGDRVQARGENHQSLRADEHKSHEDVIWMFIEKTEGLAENEVDEIIEMDIAEDLEDGLSRAVNGLARVLGLERPSDERVGEALTLAKTYTPQSQKQGVVTQPVKTGKTAEKGSAEKQRAPAKPPRYLGLLPEIDLDAIVGGRLAEADAPAQAKAFWDELHKNGRVTHRPHITLVHSKGLPQEQPLWDRCSALHLAAAPPSIIFRLGDIVCNERIMAVTVDDLRISPEGEGADMEAGAEFLEKLPPEVRKRLHITVGTRDKSVNPVEAKALVNSWRNGAKATSIALKDIESRGRVKGLMS